LKLELWGGSKKGNVTDKGKESLLYSSLIRLEKEDLMADLEKKALV